MTGTDRLAEGLKGRGAVMGAALLILGVLVALVACGREEAVSPDVNTEPAASPATAATSEPTPTPGTGQPSNVVTGTTASAVYDPNVDFASVSAGFVHTCGVRTDGSVACWGANYDGQATPPEGEFASVSAGNPGACGVRTDGSLACWGDDRLGQATLPEGEFASVSAGAGYACGVRNDGSVACWGDSRLGQATLSEGEFASVSAGIDSLGGPYACGVRNDGSVACWGDDYAGEATPPEGRFTSVSAGVRHTCGVRTDGSLACWGDDRLGQATSPEGEFASVSSGGRHTCGVRTNGSVACWGDDVHGQATPPEGEFASISVGGDLVTISKSDAALTAVPDEGTSQLKQAQVIGGLLVIAHQDRPALGQPAQGAFYHPPAGREGFLTPVVQFLLPNSPDMRTVPEGGNGPMTGGIVIPFLQAQVLHAFRARDYNVLQGRSQEFRIMDVGSSHRHAQGPACCVDQDALLAPSFAPVGGVGSNRAPPKRALPMEQSADCHSQSTPPSSSQPSTRAAQMPSSTPHPTQRWKVRWMVLSSPNSLGKWFHWQLLRIRKIMPSSILRWSALLRPLALGGSNSSITGSICSHRSSGTSQIVGSAFPSTTIHLHPSLGTILATTLTH